MTDEMRKAIQEAEIVPFWPEWKSTDREAVPPELIGAKIVAIGTNPGSDLLGGGGLFVDYIPNGSNCERRIALQFNDQGMGMRFIGQPLVAHPPR
jgi:hypothetical protein